MAGALKSCFDGRPVLVTGHTGFKGGWLTLWLKALGARVTGLALPPEDDRPSFFEAARVGDGIVSLLDDIRDLSNVTAALCDHRPEIVFHLAAQSLVRRSYREPVETYATNVMGTAHVLEAARHTPSVRAVVIVTSDKCYDNLESDHAYRETDPMGGYDPYSSSKGATELVTASYRSSFFHPDRLAEHGAGVATARAGNVIGGGDWADDRLVPDCVRALAAGQPIEVRSPRSVRPWQHVLEPLSGYLWLAARLAEDPSAYAEAWNFGPETGGNATVGEVVAQVAEEWGSGEWKDASADDPAALHEATYLRLDCAKAAARLAWRPTLPLQESIAKTVSWYRAHAKDPAFDGRAAAQAQIDAYTSAARAAGIPWAR